jgi:hypothetical protein
MAKNPLMEYAQIYGGGLGKNIFSGNIQGNQSIYDRNREADAKANMPPNPAPFAGLMSKLGQIFGRDKKGSDYTPGTNVTPDNTGSVFSEYPADDIDYGDKEEVILDDNGDPVSVDETIGGELSNVAGAAGTLLPDLDAKKGMLGWLPDYFEGKQGLIPDYFQGKQGLFPDYLPSIGWDAAPEISSKLGKGFYDTKNKLGDWLYNQYNFGSGKSAGDIERSQYPEELPMEEYMKMYGSSEAGELDENTMYNMEQDEMYDDYLDEGSSFDTDFYGTSSEPGKSYNIGFNPNADLLGMGNQNINKRTKGILGALKLRGM